ncbi:MAG TPA: DUF433 domain-containing protein [Streptosporangiaceae bacterium]|nr:DUF433 domain-containing protein [Streptosporangiaceae bacterium]
MSVSVLEREMFTEAEAARLLRMPQRTLGYWLEGGIRRGVTYRPVIREEPRGAHAPVTWAEFVEAGLLRQYRRKNVPMRELRGFIDRVRRDFGIPYPLADQQPYVGGKELLSRAQDAVGLDADLCLVAYVRGQYVLTPAADAFYQRVTWEDDTAAAWRPHDDPQSPVLIQPGIRGGRPAVKGISTEILWEQEQAGEAVSDIAADFDLTEEDVVYAIAYETSARARAA